MNYNPFSLEGKTILVTGSSSGIGRATCIEASKMGAKVVLNARDENRLNETFELLSGTGHKIFQADLVKEEEMNKLVDALPSIDGAVLCAGKPMTAPLQFCTREKFDSIFNINFFAPVELLRLLYKKKKLVKESSVVMISSIGGTLSFGFGNSVYGASKAALSSIVRSSAKEFAARKVRVNAICPAMVDTPLIHGSTITEDQLNEDMKKYPLGRYGKPEEIAYAAIYLLSDAAAWVTGTSLVLDGGHTI